MILDNLGSLGVGRRGHRVGEGEEGCGTEEGECRKPKTTLHDII